MENVNDTYFAGLYKDLWKSLIPMELTPKEVDFIIQNYNLVLGSRVLDVMCGYGRHAIALGEKGITVTAVDNLSEYINEIQHAATEKNIPVTGVAANLKDYEMEGTYDLAICMGNSLNFFPRSEALMILRNIWRHLTVAGGLLINTWSLTEIVIKTFAARGWNEVDGVKHIVENRFLFRPTRIESSSLFLSPDGKQEYKQAIDYIFSMAEIEELLRDSGFDLLEVYSIPGKKKFAIGDPRAYIVARKHD